MDSKDTRIAAMATMEIHRQILSAKPTLLQWINSSETKADAKASMMDKASDLKIDESRLRMDVGTRVRALPVRKVISSDFPQRTPICFSGVEVEATLCVDSPQGEEKKLQQIPHFIGEKKLQQIPHFIGMNTFVSEFDSEGGSSRVYACITCDRQFPKPGFCYCDRKFKLIIDGRLELVPDPITSNLSGGGMRSMHNHSSSGEIIGFAHDDSDADNEMGSMHSPDHTLHHRAPIVTMSNVSDEQTDLSDSPPTAKSSRPLQLLWELHEKEKEDRRDHGEPSWVLNVPSKHSDVKTGGTNSSGRVHGGPALALWGKSSPQGFARDIEMESMHSSGQVQGELASVHSSSYDYARDTEIESVDPLPHEDTWQRSAWQRSAAMIDPMFSVIVQGAGSLWLTKRATVLRQLRTFCFTSLCLFMWSRS
ncbi:uncharacterized protein LOC120287781 [Eucalyptus grandis]|uniref:uncharacterized protein LOC120287781 n=1 Tax=Eucalyptus grandis TaxID=71139 RepID=UPI00192EB8C9|nr:uncharacterized protein LOC120287781 [Eucalyptus grandis]